MAAAADGARHRRGGLRHQRQLPDGGDRRADRKRGLGARHAQDLEPGQVVHDGPHHRGADARGAPRQEHLACQGPRIADSAWLRPVPSLLAIQHVGSRAC